MLSAQFWGGSILNVRAVIVEFTGSSLIRTCLLILCIYLYQLNFRHEKTPETLIVLEFFGVHLFRPLVMSSFHEKTNIENYLIL